MMLGRVVPTDWKNAYSSTKEKTMVEQDSKYSNQHTCI